MREVRMDKATLKQILTGNAESHKAEFLDLNDAYRSALRDHFKDQLRAMENGDEPELRVNLPEPVDHTDDYDRAIEMLNYELSDSVTLLQAEFRSFVQDEWSWKHEHMGTSAYYAAAH